MTLARTAAVGVSIAAPILLLACSNPSSAMGDASPQDQSGSSAQDLAAPVDAAGPAGPGWTLGAEAFCADDGKGLCYAKGLRPQDPYIMNLASAPACTTGDILGFLFPTGGAPQPGDYKVSPFTTLADWPNAPATGEVKMSLSRTVASKSEGWFAASGTVTVSTLAGKLKTTFTGIPMKEQTTMAQASITGTALCP